MCICNLSLGTYIHSRVVNHRYPHAHSVTSHLGSGQFGTVNKGEWQSPKGSVAVAIKTLQAGSKQEDAVKFLQEAAISGQFRHPNVVKLIGVVTVGEPVSATS